MIQSAQALQGKIALVTGASRGIGRAVARRYAQEGAHVIVLGRDVAGLESLDDEVQSLGASPLTLVPLDLNDLHALENLGPSLYPRFNHLDIVVGNAGILGQLGPIHQVPPRVWEETLRVNLTANWALIQTCDPLLRRSPHGRFIFVTSGVSSGPHPYWGPYVVSKAGLEAMVQTYAAEVKEGSTIRANLVNPGCVRTAMRAQAMPGEDPLTLPHPDTVTQIFVDLALPDCQAAGKIHKAA